MRSGLLSLLIAPPLIIALTTTPTLTSPSLRQCVTNAEAMHAAELSSEVSLAFAPDEDDTAAPAMHFGNDAFHTPHDVGVRFAGPDAAALTNPGYVHRTAFPILTDSECDALREEAGAAMARGVTSTFTYTAAENLGEVHVADLPDGRLWLKRKLQTTLLPLLSSRFGLETSELRVYDSLIIHYDAARNGTRQPMHRDAALISLNIALSHEDEYSGGGTLFEGTGMVLQQPRGHAMAHASGVRHAGHAISQGERWVLVVFFLHTGVPQYARRCGEAASLAKAHANQLFRAGGNDEAVVAQAEEALEKADAALAAGLEIAPHDHELHHAMAGLHAMRAKDELARKSLRTAAELYPLCPKPRNALGSMLIAAGRHRAALRHFSAAFELAPPTSTPDDVIDDDDAWEAAVNGGLCIVELLSSGKRRSPMPISQALTWLRGAQNAAPDEPRLAALVRRAEDLAIDLV